MIFAIVFAQVWGVIQLLALGSLTRTVRVRTVITAMALGLYAVAPVAVIIQKAWIGIAASLLGRSMADAGWLFVREDGSPLPNEELPFRQALRTDPRRPPYPESRRTVSPALLRDPGRRTILS